MNFLPFIIAATALSVAAQAMAGDPGAIITQRARNVANQPAPAPVRPAAVRPAAAQPVAPVVRPAVRPMPASATNTPAVAALTPEQEAAFKTLIADLNVIKPGGAPSEAQRAQVRKSLGALAPPSAAPSAETMTSLANDLSTAWATQKLTAVQQTRLAKDLQKVLNSPSLSAADAKSAVASAEVLLKFGGMESGALQKVVADLDAIAATAKP